MRCHAYLTSFQDAESLIQVYKARVKYFYGANVDMVNFANIEEEIAGRLPQDIDLLPQQQREILSADSPLALLSANYFQVVRRLLRQNIFTESKIFLETI